MDGGVLLVLVVLLAAALRVATPVLLAALGELFAERAGILNLGVEGTMMAGALAGFVVAHRSGSLAWGLAGAVVTGLAAGLLMALLSVYLGLNQHVSGLGITLLGTGLSLYLYRLLYGGLSVPPRIEPFGRVGVPDSLGPLKPLLEQYTLTYVALALVPLVWWVLFRTSFGLRVRAVGENPEAADVAGVNVFRIRTVALGLAGILMALGGAFLSLSQLGAFTYGIIAGRGWVAIALVIFGNWHPAKVLGGALLFGFVQALQLRIQATGLAIPYQALLALPYLVTIAALVVASRNAEYPAALLKPYKREA